MIDFKNDDLIYPGQLKNKLNLDIKKIYELLFEIKKTGYIEMRYEAYCFKCNTPQNSIFEVISSIPDDLTCNSCNEKIGALDGTIMIFKAIKDSDDKLNECNY